MISRHEGGAGNCQKKRDNHYITSLNKKRDNGGGGNFQKRCDIIFERSLKTFVIDKYHFGKAIIQTIE